MKLQHLFLLLVLAVYTMGAGSEEFRISGTVTKKGGGPLSGVTVLLKGKKISMVTGATGAFELAAPVAVRMNAPQAQSLTFMLRGNALAFAQSAGKLSGKVSVLSGNGKCIASTDFTGLNPATDQITLPQLASGFNIVRITVNSTVYTCQILRLGNELHLITRHTDVASDGEFTLAKSAAAAAVDTLLATKAGFKDAVKPVESYTLTNISIEMDSIVGSTGGIAWGKKENPTAGCTVKGTMPEYSALKANSKLPDPFKMLDGTRITNKSDWACRREEMLRQTLKYIFGDKPIPAEGSVSGTVSTTKISVKVTEGSKSCSFEATVSMNGATAPAPAILIYDGGMGSSLPIPSGVAKINFKAIEASGGSGAKTGPFYTFYGSNHPAGYLTAQA